MLWNKRKPNEQPALDVDLASHSGVRGTDSDRAIDSLGTLLKIYGRFAFDTEQAASTIREQCERWAQRITLGEVRGSPGVEPPANAVRRDWHGLQVFFDGQRQREGEYVTRCLAGLRGTVLALARCLSGGAGEDRETDAQLARCLDSLSRALTKRDFSAVSLAASAVIESAGEAIARRRSREARQVKDLAERLRALQSYLSDGLKNAVTDDLTGLSGRAAYEQQLEQLAAIGMLLEQAPWLAVMHIHPSGKPEHHGKLDDTMIREVSEVVTRTFLRRQDFVARSGEKELAVLVVDMTEAQLVAAIERLLAGLRKLAEGHRRGTEPSVTIGLAGLRPSEDPPHWRARAEKALARAKEDGGDRYELSRI
jgi:diguanylate cyclase (GGDEF)-like protein